MSLNKSATAFTPKWMSAPAAPAPAAAAAPAPTAAPAPAAAEESKPKLSSTASSFVPRSMRTAAPAPAATPVEKPKPVSELGALPPRAPQGAWGKGRPPVTHKAVSPAAKPATPAKKPGTPGSKPVTPGGRPATPGEVYRPPQKLLTEVMIAAKAATLKKDAAVFVPKKGFPPPMKMVTPPVTPHQQPAAASHADPAAADMGEEHVADENAKMPLSRPWALYFVDRAPQGQAAYDPTLVYTMKSVEDFWRTINNVPSLTHGNPGSTYYFFRDGIHPKWEDAGNQGGGSWTMRLFSSRDLTSEAIDEIWDRLLCRAVGEAWPAALKGTLNGLVAKMRDRAITIQFWMTRRVDEFPAEIMTLIGDLYKAFTLDYISHEAAEEAAVEREKLEREKAKAQKKKDKKRH